MESNTLAMKNLLESKSCENCSKYYECNADFKAEPNSMFSVYKNIEATLKEHNEKFNVLANKLNIQYNLQIENNPLKNKKNSETGLFINSFVWSASPC